MLPKIAASYARQHHLALIALFIALGGTSYAAIKLPRNSVGPKQLRNDAVTQAKIKADAVTGEAVKKGSLALSDIKGKDIKGLQGAQGAKGEKGLAGAMGPQGVPGPTQAAASQTGESTPVGYSTNSSKIITTATAGKLWVEGVDNYNASGCASGNYSVALFVDGSYVPGTRRDLALPDAPAVIRSTTSTFGVTGSLPAGSHTVALMGQLVNCSGSFGVDSLVGAIAVGE